LTKKHVNDTRKIETKTWIGKTGQTKYNMIINFGENALSAYAKGTDLRACIPELNSEFEWIEIDVVKKSIKIKLN